VEKSRNWKYSTDGEAEHNVMKTLKRSIWQRIFGICATQKPQDEECWTYSEELLTIDLSRVPELSQPAGAIRLEDDKLPERVLIIHGDNGKYYAFKNRCQHMGRRLDPVPDTETVQCCSISKSTYEYDGRAISGPAKKPLTIYPMDIDNGKLFVNLEK
jgi:nitrite reductase/ring-hydroxylating ferredoxin subunit